MLESTGGRWPEPFAAKNASRLTSGDRCGTYSSDGEPGESSGELELVLLVVVDTAGVLAIDNGLSDRSGPYNAAAKAVVAVAESSGLGGTSQEEVLDVELTLEFELVRERSSSAGAGSRTSAAN